MLKITNLTAGYGGPAIIQNIHLTVGEGEIVTIIGPNGAGKSTVLRSIFGLTHILEGEIHFCSQSLRGVPTTQISDRGVCYMPQGRSVFGSMTVEENILMGAYIRSDAKEIRQQRDRVYAKFPRLRERRHHRAKLLSGGEQQMIALGRALMLEPDLLLLDEPSIGLSPKVVAEVFEKIQEINRDGTSILMVEQNAATALQISHRGYVLELGRNKLEGAGKELLRDERVREAYLGGVVA